MFVNNFSRIEYISVHTRDSLLIMWHEYEAWHLTMRAQKKDEISIHAYK